jgi:hypothetical protein
MDFSDVQGLLEALGATEEPLGIYYTDIKPTEGYSPETPLVRGGGQK